MQISIVVVVDVVAALKEKSIDDNAYVIDNTQAFVCGNDEAGVQATRVAGVCNADGSQAEEVVLNWIVMSVAALPTTLPRDYAYRDPAGENDAHLLNAVREARSAADIKKVLAERNNAFRIAPPQFFQQPDGSMISPDMSLLDTTGRPVLDIDLEAAAYVPLRVDAIRGPAVDESVMFPALYGSPDMKSLGWYWSASVDTARTGRHAYCMDIVLHRPTSRQGCVVWIPESFTMTGWIDVTRAAKVNGFTGHAGTGLLPLLPARAAAPGDVI